MVGLSLLWFAPIIAVNASPTCDTKTSSAQADQVLNLIKSNEQSIVLELCTPGYQVQERKIDGVAYHSLSIDSCGETSEVGQPQLPIKGVMLGVPPGAKFEVRVLETDTSVAAERYNVYPVPKVVIREDHYGLESLRELSGLSSKGIEYVFAKDEGVYSTNGFRPTDLVEVTSSGYIRDQRFVRLQLNPLQYNPVSQQLRFHKRMKVELRFVYDGGKATLAAGTGEIGGPFEGVMKNSLLNYELAKGWRSRDALRPVSIQGENPPASQLSWKVAVNEDGIYKLSYAELSTEGFPSGVISSTLKLFNDGGEVAIYVDDSEGSFGSGDYILFYGQKINTKYTDTNIYWLTYGEASGLRMLPKNGSGLGTVPDSFRTTMHLEENNEYWSSVPREEHADHWYWNYFYVPSLPTQSYATTLSNIAVGSYTCTLRSRIQGYTPNHHHLDFYINGQHDGNLVADWDGQTEYTGEIPFPQSYLIEGVNTIEITATSAVADIGVINWFEIDYYDTYTAENDSLRFSGDVTGTITTWEYHVDGFTVANTEDYDIFDITDPANVSFIINATVESGSPYTLKFTDTITDRREYWALTTAQRLSPLSVVQDASSDLRSMSNGADYIIITPSDFAVHLPGDRDDIYDLESYRQSQGPRTMVVDVQDVYDEFSYGIFDAQAIHDFLAYAYENWVAPAPSYVLLVGDGNFDFKDNRGTGEPNYIPPYLAMVDDVIGETATDNRYACVNGDDILADMFIGRLPVNTTGEASTMVGKILNYEQNPAGGDWNSKVLLVADDQPDSAGDFWDLSDDIANNYIPSAYTADKMYYDSHPDDPILGHPDPPRPQPPYYSDVTDTRATIVAGINDGCLLTNYIGHGAQQFWAAESLFTTDDIASLSNEGRLPMMLPMTCYEGYFHDPTAPSLGESIVRTEGKGAIASWSATGAGMALGHHYMNKGFFTAVFSDTISEIGMATYLGKLNLYESTTGYRDLMDTYVLFGDPFMKLNLPACDAADFDKDRRITVGDIMQVAARWDTEWGDAGFDRKYDLDDDGEITVVDIMRVATQWRETCATP